MTAASRQAAPAPAVRVTAGTRRPLPPLPDPATAARQRLAAGLLPLLPHPGGTALHTGTLTDLLGLDPAARQQVWECLDRLARGGMAHRTRHGARSYWRQTRLLTGLFEALPGPDDAPDPLTVIARRLTLPEQHVAAGLTALAWCALAYRTPATRRCPGGARWRRRPTSSTAVPCPARVVTLIGRHPSHPRAATLAQTELAQAALDALTGAGILTVADHQVLHAGTATGRPGAAGLPATQLLATVRGADLVIAAAPACPGTVAGCLTTVLDQLRPHALRGTVAIAVTADTTGGPQGTTGRDVTAVLHHCGARLPAPPLTATAATPARDRAAAWAADHAAAIYHALIQRTHRHHAPAAGSAEPGRLRRRALWRTAAGR